MPNLREIVLSVRSHAFDQSDWLYIAGSPEDLSLETEADLGYAEFDEDADGEIEPAGYQQRGLRSTIDVDTVLACIDWADRLAGKKDDAAALDIIRYYIRFDAWPETLRAPDPPPWEETQRRLDREFVDRLRPESASNLCRQVGCERGSAKLSAFCIRHHFEKVQNRPYPFDD